MCTKNLNPYQILVQNYLSVKSFANNANATSEANEAYNNYYQTMLKNIAQESGNLELQFNTIFQHLVHAFLHPLTQKDPSTIDWENAPEQDSYASDQLEWWTSLFASIQWYNPDAHMISTQLMDFSIDNPYPVSTSTSVESFILFTRVIMDAGELEHTNDWDPFIRFHLYGGKTIDTETGYEELEMVYDESLPKGAQAIKFAIRYVDFVDNDCDPVYKKLPSADLEYISINYEG